MKVNILGLDLIKHFESLHDGDLSKIGLQPKMCPAKIWTEGWGHAMIHPTEKRFLKGEKDRALAYKFSQVYTEAEADRLLLADLPAYADAVLRMITRRDLQEHEFSALLSFCYNCGTHYTDSKGKKRPYAIWKNVDARMPADQLQAYWDASVIRGGGQVLPGLVRRRKSEAHLFRYGALKFKF